jgi:PKD repeat protein
VSDSVKVTVVSVDSTFTHNGTSGKNQVSFVAGEAFANTYSWDFGDGSAPSGFRSTAHFFAANGNYNVCLTVSKNGCTYTTCQTVSVTRTDAQSLEDLKQHLLVYPNPASDEVRITSPVEATRVTLFNELGALVWTATPNNQNIIVPLTNVKPGMYFISVETQAGNVRQKITVIK